MSRSQPARHERRRMHLAEQKLDRRTAHPPDRVVLALAAAFLLSGAAGLVHEVVWARLLGLVFGATALAISTVLAAYMGGLALGSWWIGKRADRLADGRRAYALLELGIGIGAIGVPIVLRLVEPVYGVVWRHTHASFATVSLLRLVLAGAILIGPTILMGATLPVLADYCARLQRRALPPQWLYTVNLLGAVGGVALAAFVLMPALGVWGTVLAAGAINIGVGFGVLALPPLPAAAPAAVARATAPPLAPGLPGLMVAAAFFSGLLSMASQVAWTRVLALIVGSTTYAFSSVLIVFLLALGAGSAFASWRGERVRHVGPDLAVAHGLFALTLLVALHAVNRLPYWYLRLSNAFAPDTLSGVFTLQVAVVCTVLVVPVVCAGTILPLVLVAAAPAEGRGTGAAVGRVYAVNTLGAIVGALVGGFVIIPRFGSETTLLGVCVIAAVLAIAFAATAAQPRWLLPAALVTVGAVGAGVLLRPDWDFNELHSGVFEPGRITWEPGMSLTEEGERVLYEREGPTASVLVGKRPSGNTNLVINARVNASDSPTDMGTQVLLAEVPLLLAPRADDVFMLGWGSGVTAGSILLWPGTHLTAVEIEPAVVEGSRFFEHVNNHPFQHADRLHLYTDDARHILLADEATYDVIVSEPSHPWVSGVANLFTRDFYRIVAQRLRPDGIFTQWLQAYQISPESFRAIIAAARSVFPEIMILKLPHGWDTILIASQQELKIDLDRLTERWRVTPVRADLARVQVKRPEDILSLIYAGPPSVREMAAGVPENTDDNMYVELRGPRELLKRAGAAQAIAALLTRHATPIETMLARPESLLDNRERLAAYVAALGTQKRATAPYDERLRGLQ